MASTPALPIWFSYKASSRTVEFSVIAAANPKFGSFDDQKDPQENIEFQSTILSRFDAIFIVLDERNEEKDTHLSKHVMNMHAKAAAPGAAPGTHRHSLPGRC